MLDGLQAHVDGGRYVVDPSDPRTKGLIGTALEVPSYWWHHEEDAAAVHRRAHHACEVVGFVPADAAPFLPEHAGLHGRACKAPRFVIEDSSGLCYCMTEGAVHQYASRAAEDAPRRARSAVARKRGAKGGAAASGPAASATGPRRAGRPGEGVAEGARRGRDAAALPDHAAAETEKFTSVLRFLETHYRSTIMDYEARLQVLHAKLRKEAQSRAKAEHREMEMLRRLRAVERGSAAARSEDRAKKRGREAAHA